MVYCLPHKECKYCLVVGAYIPGMDAIMAIKMKIYEVREFYFCAVTNVFV